MIRTIALTVGLLLFCSAAVAQVGTDTFDRLSWPVDCVAGQDCFIQHYVDRDMGPRVRDVGCGSLSYDGHKGTDIALPSRAAQTRGVAILAAAPGLVRGLRQEMPDVLQGDAGAPDVTGRECGNGVVIEQDDGLLALYCHMKNGSVAVSRGQQVKAGDRLGLIGLSGNTTFPHLHFELLDGDVPIDPFAPDPAASGCAPHAALWADPVTYVPGGLIATGLNPDVPSYAAVKQGLVTRSRMADPPRLIAWAFGYGARKGDTVDIRITGPGTTLLNETTTMSDAQAQFYVYFGVPRRASGWTAGEYAAEITLRRGQTVLGRARPEVRIDGS